jgi:GntR family transcriptional regulator, transcriptional repressor for pyruvate dehydrogenase complex
MQALFKKISECRAYEKIVNQIMEAILGGEVKPKGKLPSETELAKMFGVSRVTVREALRSLEQFGIIEIRQGRLGGSFIREMDPDEIVSQMANALRMTSVNINQLNEARWILEESILARMGNWKINENHLKALEKNIKTAEALFHNKKIKERAQTNFEFHTTISEMTGNPIVIVIHKLIIKMISTFFEQVKPSDLMVKRTNVEHKKIVSLLRKKQFEQASALCSKHLCSMGSMIVKKSHRQSILRKR